MIKTHVFIKVLAYGVVFRAAAANAALILFNEEPNFNTVKLSIILYIGTYIMKMQHAICIFRF